MNSHTHSVPVCLMINTAVGVVVGLLYQDIHSDTIPYRYIVTIPYRYTVTIPYRYTVTIPYRYTVTIPYRYTVTDSTVLYTSSI